MKMYTPGDCLSWHRMVSAGGSPDFLLYFTKTQRTHSAIRIWDFDTACILHSLEAHFALISCVAVSPDSRFFRTASYDNTIEVRACESDELLGACADTRSRLGRPRSVMTEVALLQDRTIVLFAPGTLLH